jgi:sugar lactone lactonase YvrE
MTIDADGMLWIAQWDGWRIIRWNPITGKPIERIALPIARGTSCTFGGANLRDLYVTSARKELSPEELTHQPLAGSLFVIKDCGQGVPAFEFRC